MILKQLDPSPSRATGLIVNYTVCQRIYIGSLVVSKKCPKSTLYSRFLFLLLAVQYNYQCPTSEKISFFENLSIK